VRARARARARVCVCVRACVRVRAMGRKGCDGHCLQVNEAMFGLLTSERAEGASPEHKAQVVPLARARTRARRFAQACDALSCRRVLVGRAGPRCDSWSEVGGPAGFEGGYCGL
jgi:hypothetical protein